MMRLLVVLLLTVAACGGETPERGGPIDHPRGPRRLVLRIETGGGLVPLGTRLTELPQLSVYGDGTAVLATASGPSPPPALPALKERSLTEAGIQRLLRLASEIGLTGGDRRYENRAIFDATTTVVTVVAEGRTSRTSAYALGYGDEGVPDRDREPRARLLAFVQAAGDLDATLGHDAGELAPYVPDGLLVFVLAPDTAPVSGSQADILRWPIAPPLDRLGDPLPGYGPGDEGVPAVRCAVLRGADLRRVLRSAGGATVQTIWRSGDTTHALSFRPLLPDEEGCADATA